jgi:hypothetical protein
LQARSNHVQQTSPLTAEALALAGIDRRKVLALTSAVAGFLGGCIERLPSGVLGDDTSGTDSGRRYRVSRSVTVTGESAAPVDFAVTVASETIAPEQPGLLEFSITNTQEEPIDVKSGPIPPFGVLFATPEGGRDGFFLWNDAYASSSHVQVEEGSISVADVGIQTEVEPGEQIQRTYEIRYDADGLTPGEYTVDDVSGLGLKYGSTEYEVSLEITE